MRIEMIGIREIRLTALLLLMAWIPLHAQNPDWTWAKSGGGSGHDFSTSIATDANGNIVVCGWFSSSSMTIGTTTLTNNGVFDVFVAKYDPNGNVIWAISAGGTGDDNGNAITTDANGNIYVTGQYSSPSITFGTTTLINSSSGTGDIFLVKYDPSGNVTWVDAFGGSDWDVGQSVATDPSNGSVYLAGYLSSAGVDFGSGPLSTNGLADAFLAKFDANGNAQWSVSAGGTVNDLANGVDLDQNGNVFITGGFASSSITFGSNTLNNAGPGTPDIFTAKYDPSGNHIWSIREGGNDNDHTVAVDIDPWGNVIVAGHYHSASFNVGTTTLTNGGMGDPFIFKYTNAGNIIWARDAGSMENDFAYSVAVDSSGNAYLAGMYKSNSITFGSEMLTNSSLPSGEDMFLVKYDSSGAVQWAKGDGSTYSDYINDICIDGPSDKLFATGDYFSQSITMGTTLLSNQDNTGNTADHFVAKLDVVTGMPVSSDASQASVHPNPTRDKVFINVSGKVTVTIYNSLGEKLSETDQKTVDLKEYGKGVYFVGIRGEGMNEFHKVILE